MKNTIVLTLLLLSLNQLLAQDPWEWTRQNPDILPVDMIDVHMTASGKGLAVGERGTAFYTQDFGENWALLPAPSPFLTLHQAKLYEGASQEILFIGASGRLYYSTDGGQTWPFYTLMPSPGSPSLIEVYDENTFLVGGNAGLVKTTNGGQSWTDLSPGDGSLEFRSFSFVDQNHGWAGTETGEIYGTTDGGQNWTQQSSGVFSNAIQLDFFDENIGYAGHFRDLLKTTDGGQTWTVELINAFGSSVRDTEAADAQTVYFSQGNRVFRTIDGGASVSLTIPSAYSNTNRGISTLPGGRVWVASSYLQITYSEDAGLNYIDQVDGIRSLLSFTDFLDHNTGITGGQNGVLLYTNNAGNDWLDISSQLDPSWQNFADGFLVTDNEFYLAVDNNIIHTTDAGDSWEVIYSIPTEFTTVIPTDFGFMAADFAGNVHRSTDGGQSWTAAEIEAGLVANKLQFLDDLNGFAVGRNGLAHKTTDGGLSWNQMNVPNTGANYLSLFFRNPNEGFLSFDQFSTELLHTTDGGDSWTTINIPATAFWRAIHFEQDSDVGYVGGGSSNAGRIYQTQDGGLTWEAMTTFTEFMWDMAVVTDEFYKSIWLVGFGGLIEMGSLALVNTREQSLLPLSIGPNPVADQLYIQLPTNLSNQAKFLLYNTNGQLLKTYPVQPNLDLQDLSPGSYHLLLQDEGQHYGTSVIKN